MSTKEEILSRYRQNMKIQGTYDMPDVDAIKGVVYPDPVAQFIKATEASGGRVARLGDGEDINGLIKSLYPEARVVASNLPEVTVAQLNPDTVPDAQALDGVDVGVVRGSMGVAENGCVWIEQTMKERAVCFMSEYLVILLDSNAIVNNMHEAYRRVSFNDYGYGTFISGPSKTADIAQALVMGAQAARGVTVVLV